MVKRLLLALVGILFFTFVIFSYLDYKFEITRFAKLGTDVIQPTALDIPGGILGIVCCVIDFVKEVKRIKAMAQMTQMTQGTIPCVDKKRMTQGTMTQGTMTQGTG